MNCITKKICGDNLILKVYDHIDTQNSGMFQQEIEEALSEGPFKSVVLDADDLTYISSAGLRVILMVKKRVPDFSIINTSRDVYDIFEMTGFNNIIDVKKAYRKFSVDGLELIGQGTCGKVYRLNSETIIKVFNDGFDLSKIEKEQNSAKKAFLNGIDTAISFDIVKVDSQFGIIYEILEADTIRSCIKKAPDKLEYFTRIYSEFLKNMHNTHFEPNILPEVKYSWIGSIDYMDKYFTDDEKKSVKEMFENVPDRDTFIHGDYNVGNLLCQNGKAILIDMADASTGHPIYDVAGVYLGFKLFPELIPSEYCEKMTGFCKDDNNRMWEIFCEVYFNTTDNKAVKEYEDEIRPFAAFRVLQASLVVNAFPPQMLDTCKNLLFKSLKNGIKPLNF